MLVTGDMALGLNFFELETAVRHGIKLVVILLNNDGPSGERRQHKAFPAGHGERLLAYERAVAARVAQAEAALGPLASVGIGHPGNKNEVANWVLKKPSPDDRIAIAQALDRSLKALPQLIAGEMDKATALIHTSKPPRPKPPRPAPAADQAEGPPSAVKD